MTSKHSRKPIAVALVFSAISFSADAAFYSYGHGMVYDSSLNITWMQDANLLGTQLAGNSNLVNQIIAANGGAVTDSLGSHALSATKDFGAGGQVSWWGAKAYMTYLNSIQYNGISTWRLAANQPINGTTWQPTSFSPAQYDGSSDFGYHILSPQSEMAYLYGIGLNHDSQALYTTTGDSNPSWTVPSMSFQNAANNNAADSFFNVSLGETASYWSNTESPYNLNQAWRFNFYSGGQLIRSKTHPGYYAWAVAPGNVAAVPVPAAIWLFGSSIAGLMGLNCRRSALRA